MATEDIPMDDVPIIYPTSSFLSIDDVRKFVARETEKQRLAVLFAKTRIAQLYSFQNAFAPANSLPPELLRQIFSYLNLPKGCNANLIRATHVCKLWRTVALADPSLWSSFALPFHSPDGLRAYLSRSKGMPLSLSLVSPPSSASTACVQEASHRIRSLVVSIPEAEGIETILNTLKAGAPLLEELRVKQSTGFRGGWFRDRPVMLTGPHFVYDETVQLPSLRTMSLDDVPLPFLPPSTLQHLDLTMSVRTSRFPLPSLPRLLSLLERCPHLREAKIRGRPEESDDPIPCTMIPLPDLRQLALTLYPLHANATLLSHLVLPEAQTTLCVRGQVRASVGETMAHMLLLLHPAHPSLRWTKALRRLLLMWTPGRWDLHAHCGVDDFTGTPELSLAGRAHAHEGLPLRGLVGGWAFSTENIEVAVLSFVPRANGGVGNFAGDPITHGQWVAALEALPALRTLRVIGLVSEDVWALVEVLGRTEPTVLCPKLEALEFMDVRSKPWNMVWERLVNVVKVRARREGAEGGLERVEFFNCCVTVESAEKEFNDFGVDLVVE